MTARKRKAPTVSEVLADGMDASTDGRGWGREHEEARLLADAAPELRDVLRATLDGFWHYVEQAHDDDSAACAEAATIARDHLAWAQAAIKRTELGHHPGKGVVAPAALRGLDSEELAGRYVQGQRAAVAAELARRGDMAGVFDELRDRYGFPPSELVIFARRVKAVRGRP